MQIKIHPIVYLICLTVVVLLTAEKVYSQVDPYPNIEIPMMKDGYKINKIFDQPKGTKSVNYSINIEYPADKVLMFYDKIFIESGWVISRDKMKREWSCFIDGTIKENPKVRQLLALWRHPSLKAEAFLALRYFKYDKDVNWDNGLNIVCQIQPIVETTGLDTFFKKLNKTKQQSGFMQLLDSYRLQNGEVDIEKAVKENPDNIYLKEYKEIIDKIKPNS